ncbi:hypothetical protein [Erysipelothrix anatis]|uniref:hypothetical protein n=1 Tax=Erysipelothrix anatis TaxID=2683713 RepID=UPI00135B63E6|nr:hypothetical protein [Erysipelothrix anatis]
MNYTYKGQKVKLHGIFQHSYVIRPSIAMGGHNGGQMSFPVAVIEHENGNIKQIQDIHELKGWSDEE